MIFVKERPLAIPGALNIQSPYHILCTFLTYVAHFSRQMLFSYDIIIYSKNNKGDEKSIMINENQKTNAFLLPLFIIKDIFEFAFRGIKFVFMDTFKLIFDKTSKEVDHAYQSTKQVFNHEKELEKKKKKDEQKAKWQEKYNNLWFVKKQNAKFEEMRKNLLVNLQNEGSERSATPRVFQYTARNKMGRVETSTINGYSKLDVNTFLIQEGYTIYDIKTSKTIDFLYGDTSIFAVKMSTKDLLFWLTQLSTYIKSGITLTESVKILNNQMQKKKKYRKYFQSIIYELTMGEPFSKALEKQGVLFPALLINMIRAAEATGELESTLTDMANYYEDLDKTRKQMISAITYPTIIMVFALGVITFILLYVIPQFVKIYEDSSAEITGITLMIINLSSFLKENILIIGFVFLLIIGVLYFCYKKIKAFRKNIQFFLMHMPLIGNIIIYNELTIFTKTFSSLLANNVFITDSMAILSRITNNEIYKEIMNNTIDNIVKGDKISTSFKDQWAVPDVAYYMIVTGESTGRLADMMKKVSDYYAEMHRSLVNNLKAFIEPILIAVLALVVGVIILAVILPMFGLMSSLE